MKNLVYTLHAAWYLHKTGELKTSVVKVSPDRKDIEATLEDIAAGKGNTLTGMDITCGGISTMFYSETGSAERYEFISDDVILHVSITESVITDLAGNTGKALQADIDSAAESHWKDFSKVGIDSDGTTMQDFMQFPAGTDERTILDWFDKIHSNGIMWLMENA